MANAKPGRIRLRGLQTAAENPPKKRLHRLPAKPWSRPLRPEARPTAGFHGGPGNRVRRQDWPFAGPATAPSGGPSAAHTQENMKAALDKTPVISDYRKHDKDTGSCEVQVALLSQRINHLTDHLRTHRKDFHSRRGLIAMSNQRRNLLSYLKTEDLERYKTLIERLKLRR